MHPGQRVYLILEGGEMLLGVCMGVQPSDAEGYLSASNDTVVHVYPYLIRICIPKYGVWKRQHSVRLLVN